MLFFFRKILVLDVITSLRPHHNLGACDRREDEMIFFFSYFCCFFGDFVGCLRLIVHCLWSVAASVSCAFRFRRGGSAIYFHCLLSPASDARAHNDAFSQFKMEFMCNRTTLVFGAWKIFSMQNVLATSLFGIGILWQ